MAQLIADLFVSLDGFAAGIDVGPFFGYSGPDLDAWIDGNLSRPHVTLMGRVTYEAMAAISASATDPNSLRMTELPKAVVSTTLREPLLWPHTTLLSGDPATTVSALKQQSPHPIRTIGSLTLVRSLIPLGLVDRLRLMVFPLILGPRGTEPAFAHHAETHLNHVSTTTLDHRLTLLEYAPARTGTP